MCNIKEAVKFLKFIGYKELFKINNNSKVYTDGTIELKVQLVNDKYVFIEIEEKCNYISKIYNAVDEIIKDLERYNINYDKENYFVQKALIILKEKYR